MMKRMLTGLAACLVLAGLVLAGGADEQKKLQGKWNPTKVVQDGTEVPDSAEVVMTFKDNNFSIEKGGTIIAAGTYKLDPATKPKQIDMKIEKAKNENDVGKTVYGIYKLDGDNLEWCVTKPGDATRPVEFTSEQGSKRLLVSLKKAKS